jgi:ubiquinone/menaquinone biosynthesis C-methylase UbiE
MKRKNFSVPGKFFLYFLCLALISGSWLLNSVACRPEEHSSAASFDRIARTLFKNVYIYLAQQIKQDYDLTSGICIDAGAGPAYLSIELARTSDLEIYAVDIDSKAIEIARKNIAEAGLSSRIKPVLANVEKMPFPDNFADIVVSRGSYLFWKNKVQAFKEIRRVLKPNGVTFIGGAMGNLLPPKKGEEL